MKTNGGNGSFIYVIPTLCGRNEYDGKLIAAMKNIEDTDTRNYLVTSIWGAARTEEVLAAIDKTKARGIITVGFGRANNAKLNYFEVDYKDGCETSKALAVECIGNAAELIEVPVRACPSMQYQETTTIPNPLFAAVDCPGILIKATFYTCSQNPVVAASGQGNFAKALKTIVEAAILFLDEAK